MNIDVLTAGVAFFSFGVFLSVHCVTIRRVRPEHLLKSLLVCVLAILGLPVILMVVLYILKAGNVSLQAWVFAAILASVIQGLLSFVYILCFFGPYETSVRMRLVREIASTLPGGISKDELLRRYSNETIVNLRLQRLVGSGDIIKKEGLYRLGHAQNFFFMFDHIAGVIKKWINQ